MLYAVAFIGFVVLGIACLAVLGPVGILAWLLIYGLFHAAANRLLRHVGDDGDLYHHEITRRRR